MNDSRREAWRLPIAMATIWTAFVLVPDLLTWWLDPTGHMSFKMKLVYAVTMGSSCVLWMAAGMQLAQLRARSRTLGIVAAVASALAMALWAGGTLLYRVYFDYNPRPVIFAFFLDNFVYVSSLLATSTSLTFQSCVVVAPLLLVAAVLYATRRPAPSPLPSRRLAVAALAGAVVVQSVCVVFPSRVSSTSPDLIGAKTSFAGTVLWARGTALPMLPRPERVAVAKATATRMPNVLFVVHESVGRKQVAPWTEGALDSAWAAFLRKHSDHAVWFPRATTVAPVTNVAFPSILAGLSPDAPTASFRRAPLMWHDAEAVGYTTGLFSAEDYKYSFFRGFFLAKDRPSAFKTAGELSDARTVDSGVDDAKAAEAAIEFIRATPATSPFFAVVQFNGSHFPCWDPAKPHESIDSFDDAARKTRCDRSIEHIDVQVGRLLEALEATGRLEQTLIVSTSDHGETFDPSRPKRPINFYEDTMGVPLAMHVPKSLSDANPEVVRQLDANRAVRVSNLDIYPTLLDLWGRWPLADAAKDANARPALYGQSLLRPVASDRVLVSTARGSIYEPAVQGFAFYHGDWKWLFDEKKGLQLFDLSHDPNETQDLAKTAPDVEQRFFTQQLETRPALRELLHPR